MRHRDYALLWTGQAISVFGDQVFPIAVTISALNAGASATDLGLILAARTVSLVLFALIGGVWADRLPRRWVMLGADGVRAAMVIGLMLLPTHPQMWLLALLVFVVGAGEAFFRPAMTALIPSLLPANELAPANALNSLTYRSAQVIGPAIGGILVATVGVSAAFGVDAATFIVSLICVYLVREPVRAGVAAVQRDSFLTELGDGFREVLRHRWVFAILLAAMTMLMFTIAPTNVLLPIVSKETFHTTFVYTTSMALFGLGGVCGAVLASMWQPKNRGLIGLMLGLPFAAVPLAIAFAETKYLIFVAYFFAGFGFEPLNVWWATALQQEIDRDRLARVSSIDWMMSLALLPLGLALTGPAVAVFGQTAVLVVGSVMFVLASFLPLLVPGMFQWRDPRRVQEQAAR